jgi:uncharacterized RDD family membrane protein YckC
MKCPGCGAAAPPPGARCPECGAAPALPTEGALAPDPDARPQPLREIPGLRKKERTWKDEVRERVRERRRFRGAEGDLPLFKGIDDEEGAAPEESAEIDPRAAEPVLAPPAAEGPRLLDDDLPLRADLDLPIRPRDTITRPIVAEAPRVEPPPREPARRVVAEDAPRTWDIGSPAGDVAGAALEEERPAVGLERLYAALVDVAVLAPIFAIVVYFASRAARVGIPALQPAWPYLAGYLLFLGLVYGCYFTGTTGQTVGKMAAGLRVVDAAGHPPGYLRAFVRALVGACGVLAAGLGLVPMMFDPARRAFHDRIFRTRVVKG